MLRDNQGGVESDWTCATAENTNASTTSHREIDRALRRIARVRGGLDAEEARWLRRAEQAKIWPKLGYVHGLEYLEDVFGYAPRTAQERVRVAVDLGSLPELEAALEDGTVSWSVARELTRVATAESEARWLAAAAGKNLRQVERLVAGHDKGSDPDDAPDPELEMQTVSVRLRPSTVALWRQVRALLDDERGEHLDDDAAYEAMCRRVLESGDAGSAAPASGPARTIHLTTCRACKRTTQTGSGATFDLSPSERELAECDAVICDDDNGERATHAIPPVTRRKVMARDEGRCRVPGCRAARNLDVHHIVQRAHGGGNETSNLAVLCSGHHRLLHDGLIRITGDANRELAFTRDGKLLADAAAAPTSPAMSPPVSSPVSSTVSPPVSSAIRTVPVVRARPAPSSPDAEPRSKETSRFAEVERRTLAAAALQQAGFKSSIAKRAVSIAQTRVAPGAELEALIREALRHCA